MKTFTCKICGDEVSKRKSLAYRGGRACRIHDEVSAPPPRNPALSQTQGAVKRDGPTILEFMVDLQTAGLSRPPATQAQGSPPDIPRADPIKIFNPDQGGILELLQDVRVGDEVTLRFSEGEEGFAAVNYLVLLSNSGGFDVLDPIGLLAVGSSHQWNSIPRTQKIRVTSSDFVKHMESGFAARMGQPGRGRLEWIEYAPPLTTAQTTD